MGLAWQQKAVDILSARAYIHPIHNDKRTRFPTATLATTHHPPFWRHSHSMDGTRTRTVPRTALPRATTAHHIHTHTRHRTLSTLPRRQRVRARLRNSPRAHRRIQSLPTPPFRGTCADLTPRHATAAALAATCVAASCDLPVPPDARPSRIAIPAPPPCFPPPPYTGMPRLTVRLRAAARSAILFIHAYRILSTCGRTRRNGCAGSGPLPLFHFL